METDKRPQVVAIFLSLLLSITSSLLAKGAGTSPETVLNDPLSARSSALGEALSASTNDIAAFGFNPATLRTLEQSHLSFIYQKGLLEDSRGHVSVGLPLKSQSLGLSVGYYDGGDIKTLDPMSLQEKTVQAKKELNLSIGSGFQVAGFLMGVSAKYLSSELAETEKATAFVGDVGVQRIVSPRFSFGAAIQNIGTALKYGDESDDMARTIRAGAQWQFASRMPALLLVDVPYNLVSKEVEPGLGLEFPVGPLALRTGYKDVSDEQSVSFGVGFALSNMTLDYAYGLADQLDDQHLVSVGLRFGGSAASSRDEVKIPQRNQVAFQFEKHKSLGGQIYEIKSGDSLGQIAQQMYGSRDAWKRIYEANRHLLQDPTTLTPGQKVVLP